MTLRRMRRVLFVALSTAVVIASMPASAPMTAAYDGVKAANYADATYNHCGSETVTVSGKAVSPMDSNGLQWVCSAGGGGDCTNWASQVTNAGGYSMENYSGAKKWYYKRGYTIPGIWNPYIDYWTASWVNASAWYNFLVNIDHDNGSTGPGGGFQVAQGTIDHTQHGNVLGRGDMIFFDQANVAPYRPGDYTGIDHVKVEVYWISVSGVFYDYADQHGPEMYHQPWNGSASVAGYIYQVHIDAANI